MSYLDTSGRYVGVAVDPSDDVDILTTLLGFLQRQRATFAWKTSGLGVDGLNANLGTSAMTLGGLLKHLARFEDDMSSEWLNGEPQRAPWNAVDWNTDPAWDWRTAAEDAPAALYSRWQDAVNRSQALFAQALERGQVSRPHEAPSLAYILINLIEEYARHNGHADLIRESVDGVVGHDQPT
jgi:hypothetical protein